MRHNTNWLQIILKASLFGLIIFYLGSTSLFYHTHTIGDVAIIHSHPYQKDSGGENPHSHTDKDLQQIHNLSVVGLTDIYAPYISVTRFYSDPKLLSYKSEYEIAYIQSPQYSKLRPPPSSYF
ncbi:MAG: hypothetical protein E6767_10850 [Dysgonomonas sp.]|nr:hypothetical protein [Dysgonomonas sp.]